MNDVEKKRKDFIEKLARKNRKLYGTSDGSGLLRVIKFAFEHSWVYVFELVQNALDAGARSVALRLTEDGDSLIFQHDGNCPIKKKDVKGLSKVLRSTKGASSVGFMGIGFKSIFTRFQEVRVSGWRWTFRYKVSQQVGGKYGDVQRDWLGAVIPIWDDTIAAPDGRFTTRFEMRQRTKRDTDLNSDLTHFLPDNDCTSLAILAVSGLKRLEINGRIWKLNVSAEHNGRSEATALSEGKIRRWRVFPVEFKPSREAVACFLEHRDIQPTEEKREQVEAEAARPRKVLGVLPLDENGIPDPPLRGRVYATLPTEVTVPFGLHIHADWLLNISRSGFKELEDNPWQRGITDKIADIIGAFLEWSADTHTQPDAVKATFNVLAPPLLEVGGLEKLLAEDSWLSRLRKRIEDSAVFPVWTGEPSTVKFAKPGEILVPPKPLTDAFEEKPELRPTDLLKGHVLRYDLLGDEALEFLRRIGFLTEMSPRDLERAWKDGLEEWWKTLPNNKKERRQLLFRIWAAVADLSYDEAWRDAKLPCIRSVTGKWLPVDEAAFIKGNLPKEDQPGGAETLQFMQPFIKDENRLPNQWITALDQWYSQPEDSDPMKKAWKWIKDEDNAKSISLKEIVEDAMNTLISSTTPDWSVLVPFGHWAKHGNRHDLLTHVLVESEDNPQGVPVREALLADPYIEHGQGRRCFFPDIPAIVPAYLERDPKNADAREWGEFFKRAGAQGQIEVLPIKKKAGRYDRNTVAEFLCRQVGKEDESNDDGYTLTDFDINPEIPESNAPEEQRMAFALWLNGEFNELKGKGKRQASYYFGKQKPPLEGKAPSIWVNKLSELAWIPCKDGKLRQPREILRQFDPAREDAPVAQLSSELMDVLEKEGVEFGTDIPEATALSRFLNIASKPDAKELAQCLSECRKQIETETDKNSFVQSLPNLNIPFGDDKHVPLNRIVRRAGTGYGSDLGGWIVPLDRIDKELREELKHPDFRYTVPEVTTGDQALNYIQHVWRRARSSPERLAIEVRDVLPVAYGYCLEECSKDVELSDLWNAAKPQAMVFVEREWVSLTNASNIYFDDIEDRRFIPNKGEFQTVTGGHLGRDLPERIRTVGALDLPYLSSIVKRDWDEGETLAVSFDWSSKFKFICKLLRQVRGNDPAEGDRADNGTDTRLRLLHVSKLSLKVSIGNSTAESVPVHARIHEKILTVAGQPLEFGTDASKELRRHFSFGQRADLATDLTGMLMTINDPDSFNSAAEKFRRAHVPDYELPTEFRHEATSGDMTGSAYKPDQTTVESDVPMSRVAPSNGGSSPGRSDLSTDSEAVYAPSGMPNTPGHRVSSSMGGSYTKNRAKALAEIKPPHQQDDTNKVGTTNGNPGAFHADTEERQIAAKYEREDGREPELLPFHHKGWDIRSTDPKSGTVRLIEVKGKGCPWVQDEIVELSHTQLRAAFEASGEPNTDWYLYVVEKTDNGDYQVLPISNLDLKANLVLCGESWRGLAENPKRFENPSQ